MWQGWGAPVAAAIAAVFLIPAIIIDGGEGSWTSYAFVAAGVAVVAFGQWIHMTQEGKHRLMFLPIRWFGLLFLVLGLLFVFGDNQVEAALVLHGAR